MIKQKIKPFNGEMNLLKMIGIVHVVIGHIYSQVFSVLRQPYTFHMPLFYFISGYFYDENHENEKSKYIWSKFKKSVGFFYFYLIFLIIFCSLVSWKYSISLGTISFYDIFVKPFTLGMSDPGFFFGPGWFLLSLFLVQSVFVLTYPLIKKIFKNDLHKLIFFLLLGTISIYLSNKLGLIRNEYFIMILRTITGMMFYYFGYFYKKNIENKINIFNGKILVLSLIIISILEITGINLIFGFNTMSFNGQTLTPIITSIVGIYISIFIAKGLNKIIKNENDILHIIGRNTLYIMIFHIPVFFIITLFLFKINHISQYDYSSLTHSFCPGLIDINKWWPLYISLGLLLPMLYGELVGKFKKRKIKY